ncbi:hypothetical protein [Rhizobium leguminosarum]|uniref:hypothetical protein n=1 Tax=Rhizobium leguminosarum TaxID=384 RepID=UPI002E13768A|nr:hypothetical protein U8Q02_41515 [Rhizobium leguminosarum]
MVSVARLTAIISALGSLSARDLDGLPGHSACLLVRPESHADDLLDPDNVIMSFIYGDEAFRDGIAALVSAKLDDKPVAWRGHHLHPEAQDVWSYVDGPEKPKSGIGGLAGLEPLFGQA